MKADKSWKCLSRKRICSFGGGKCGLKMMRLPFIGVLCIFMLIIVYSMMNYQHWLTEMESRMQLFGMDEEFPSIHTSLTSLPHGIIHSTSDLELKPLWSKSSSRLKSDVSKHQNLLAIAVGIKQKYNVNKMVQKFLPENFMVILFHYDGDVDGWRVFDWSNRAIHIVAQNQTKWWFAKRFLHPTIVSIYKYIFLWDEDLGVENFNPGRYLDIIISEGLEISQPALDPNSTEIHHRITIRKRMKKVHRRVYERRGNVKCSESSLNPPCTGWVEGMAPVFSRSAWQCAWHLIQNDLVHGWGLDMKLGYCAQGDRTKKVGIVDTEYIVHQGIQTLGGSAVPKRNSNAAIDARAEIRRQSTWELQTFKDRWEQAVREDGRWMDPFRTRGIPSL